MNQYIDNKDSYVVLLLDESDYPDVKSKQEKLERMFNVTLTLKEPRMVKLKGGSRDCVNARIYIHATLQLLENETRVIYLPPTPDEFIESIEIKSLASITKHTSDGSYHIRGKKINVTMAMTLLEEYAQLEKQMAEMQTTPLKIKTNKASRRLSCALQETLTKVNRRGNYAHATDAVKRAIVGCLIDENEENDKDQVDTASDKDSNSKTVTDKTEEPDVILIEDDSDDEITETVEDEEDDDVMIIETPRKIPNDNDNVFFGKHFANKQSFNNTKSQKASCESEDELSTMTMAFSELQTPSKLKADLQRPSEKLTLEPTNQDKLNDKGAKKKKKKKKNYRKRKLSSLDEEVDDIHVSPDSERVYRRGKTFVPEKNAKARRILKSKSKRTNKNVNNETCRTELDFSKAKNKISKSDKRMACRNDSSKYPQPPTETNTDRGNAVDETDGKPIANKKQVIPPLTDYRTPRRNDLRYIVIDGSNVAMSHGKNGVFSCRGIRICVEYFLRRGHELVTVFLPHWRKCRPQDINSVTHRYELDKLEKEGYLVYTPSRRIRNKLVAAYDDRFIIELADREDGIVVTNDQYRDLKHEKYSWRNIIENRLLQYSFVHDHFMVPNDPLGRYGPTLDRFLRHTDLRQTLKALDARNIMSRPEDRTGDFLMYSRR